MSPFNVGDAIMFVRPINERNFKVARNALGEVVRGGDWANDAYVRIPEIDFQVPIREGDAIVIPKKTHE